ncbi:hypothetical protein NEIG_02644 [Nematocida sp. ERTm5]|nr:hypothetical protein NEIG_02644 [Nematocida sp. ERTm5]
MRRSIRIFLIIFTIFTFITIKKIVYIVIGMNKNKSKTRKSILSQICSVQESEPIDKIGSVSTTTLPIKNQNSGFTTAISAKDDVKKEEEHLETKEESFEMIDSNPSGTTTDEKELIRMLNAIAKLNPDLPKVNYTKDKEIINAIIKNKDVVVVEREELRVINNMFQQITLWKVLNSVANGETSHQHLTMNYTRTVGFGL